MLNDIANECSEYVIGSVRRRLLLLLMMFFSSYLCVLCNLVWCVGVSLLVGRCRLQRLPDAAASSSLASKELYRSSCPLSAHQRRSWRQSSNGSDGSVRSRSIGALDDSSSNRADAADSGTSSAPSRITARWTRGVGAGRRPSYRVSNMCYTNGRAYNQRHMGVMERPHPPALCVLDGDRARSWRNGGLHHIQRSGRRNTLTSVYDDVWTT